MHPRARLYCGYSDNTNETTSNQNIWEKFPYSSSGVTTWRNSGDFTVDNSSTTFTLNRSIGGWFEVCAVCNIYKGTGGNASRNVELVWYKNGVESGFVRGSHMNNQDSNVVTGQGEMYLEPNDYIEPHIRNTENDDKILLKNCTFDIKEDCDWGY